MSIIPNIIIPSTRPTEILYNDDTVLYHKTKLENAKPDSKTRDSNVQQLSTIEEFCSINPCCLTGSSFSLIATIYYLVAAVLVLHHLL